MPTIFDVQVFNVAVTLLYVPGHRLEIVTVPDGLLVVTTGACGVPLKL